MGKLAKAFGLGSKGKIGLSVNKPSYYAGELIVGTIYVEVYEPIQCDGELPAARMNRIADAQEDYIGHVCTRSARAQGLGQRESELEGRAHGGRT